MVSWCATTNIRALAVLSTAIPPSAPARRPFVAPSATPERTKRGLSAPNGLGCHRPDPSQAHSCPNVPARAHLTPRRDLCFCLPFPSRWTPRHRAAWDGVWETLHVEGRTGSLVDPCGVARRRRVLWGALRGSRWTPTGCHARQKDDTGSRRRRCPCPHVMATHRVPWAPAYVYDAYSHQIPSTPRVGAHASSPTRPRLGSQPKCAAWAPGRPTPTTILDGIYATDDPVNRSDPSGRNSVGVCPKAGIGIGPVHLGVGGCAVATTNPFTGGTNFGLTFSGTVGVGLGADVSLGLYLQISSAKQLGTLSGPFFFYSFGAGAGLGGTFTVFWSGPTHPTVYGIDMGVTIGGGVSAYLGIQDTKVYTIKGLISDVVTTIVTFFTTTSLQSLVHSHSPTEAHITADLAKARLGVDRAKAIVSASIGRCTPTSQRA